MNSLLATRRWMSLFGGGGDELRLTCRGVMAHSEARLRPSCLGRLEPEGRGVRRKRPLEQAVAKKTRRSSRGLHQQRTRPSPARSLKLELRKDVGMGDAAASGAPEGAAIGMFCFIMATRWARSRNSWTKEHSPCSTFWEKRCRTQGPGPEEYLGVPHRAQRTRFSWTTTFPETWSSIALDVRGQASGLDLGGVSWT